MKQDITQLAKKVKLTAYRLDVPYQNHRILRAGVNLHLAHLLRGDCRHKVFPGENRNGTLTLRNCGIAFNVNELTASFAAIQRNDFDSLPPALQRIFGRPDMRHADEVMVRLAGLCNPIRTCRTDIKEFSDKMPLAEQTAILEEYDRQTTFQLARYFGLGDSPVSPLDLPASTGIHQFYMYCYTYEEDCITRFCNEAGSVIYYVVRKNLHGRHVELPITNYICGDGDEFPVYRMPDPESGNMFPLYAMDKLALFPETPVILTDILEIASEFNRISEKLIVTGFYGGEDAVPRTDIRPLFGAQRRTFWLLLNRPGCTDAAATYRTGLKMLGRFRSYDRKLYFIEPVDGRWNGPKTAGLEHACSCRSEFRELTVNEFLQKCRALKIRVSETFSDDEPEILSGSAANQVKDDLPFISPIANRGGFVIIYATAKAGKTFFALHLALSMAYGKDPVPGHWRNESGNPHRVLYISGEMTKGQFKKRKLREEAFLQPDPSLLDNISFLHVRGRRLDKPEDQKFFDCAITRENPDMIVIDNWQTLSSSGGTNRTSFDEFFRWIANWCDLGIQVTLINHTNKAGEITGSGAQAGDCDTLIRLYRATVDDTIRILITPQDYRDGKHSLFHPILASYDFDDPAKSDWTFETPDGKFAEAIQNWNEKGCKESDFPKDETAEA